VEFAWLLWRSLLLALEEATRRFRAGAPLRPGWQSSSPNLRRLMPWEEEGYPGHEGDWEVIGGGRAFAAGAVGRGASCVSSGPPSEPWRPEVRRLAGDRSAGAGVLPASGGHVAYEAPDLLEGRARFREMQKVRCDSPRTVKTMPSPA
jgi:hypothetical protein